MDTLFISDVHLAEAQPEKIELLIHFLQGPARKAKALYILGDLFENFWLGNDDRTPPARRIITELKHLADSGVPLYFMRGNREFMLDAGFEKLTGCTVLDDYHVINLDGVKTLLMHGDRLCTRDTRYQRYRKFITHPAIKGLFLTLPYAIRRFMVRGLQPVMRKTADSKQPEIVDVDQAEVLSTMKTYAVKELIHGHTHRPGIHEFDLDGHPARRTVLNDWYVDDSVLVVRNGLKQLLGVQQYIEEQA